jgi:hypothetical protein
MSRTITVEVTDEVYAEIEREAASAGVTPEMRAAEKLAHRSPPQQLFVRGTGAMSPTLAALLGSASVPNPRGLDNRLIDEDLAADHADRHERK